MRQLANDHLGFTKKYSDIRRNTYIPKYYNPEIEARLLELSVTHELVSMSTLIADKHIKLSTGDEIGKMAYGTGEIPFVRTSDITNWEIKTDTKQGVSQRIYDQYATKQDVNEGDIFFVRDGTYLIGQSCFITKNDLPCLYQSHLLKIRTEEHSPVCKELVFLGLNSPIVKRQIKSKQFTADIIDTIGSRFSELLLPVSKDKNQTVRISDAIRDNIARRSILREHIRHIPFWAQGIISSKEEALPQDFLQRSEMTGNHGFNVPFSQIQSGIFMPKYYDPTLDRDIRQMSDTHDLVSIATLVNDGVISWSTGIEVGKMAYGTGNVPFIRTSDMANWELKGDPKQNVSEAIYEESKQDVVPEDILVVRDGTYLVGTSSIITQYDTKCLYCGGLYKLRVNKKNKIDPYLLLALLNTPIVRRQMRSKQFTRDIIDTIGKRLFDVVLPVPRDRRISKLLAEEVRNTIEERVHLRNAGKRLAFEVEGVDHLTSMPEDDENI